MLNIDDKEIEKLIYDYLDRIFDETDLKLSFSSISEDGFEIFYSDEKWLINKEIDPLSCLIYFEHPIPNKNLDDNLCVAAIMKMYNKSSGWVRSCQDGIRGINNSSSSISGYIFGASIRKKYVRNSKKNFK